LKVFYAVDRERKLSHGKVLCLEKHNDITPVELQKHVHELFPEGVSIHGDKYFLNNASLGNVTEPAIELMFEYVRKAHFPFITSRFQSFFACENLDEARAFKKRFNDSTLPIYEICSDSSYFKANMNLLRNGDSILVGSFFAQEYWSGRSGPDATPFWEVLLSLPITVGQQIE
jgi:hypothetical protein